jgi:hypothetical protein
MPRGTVPAVTAATKDTSPPVLFGARRLGTYRAPQRWYMLKARIDRQEDAAGGSLRVGEAAGGVSMMTAWWPGAGSPGRLNRRIGSAAACDVVFDVALCMLGRLIGRGLDRVLQQGRSNSRESAHP